MNELFVPYNLAEKLFNLDFNEPVLGHFMTKEAWKLDLSEGSLYLKGKIDIHKSDEYSIPAPLWDQAFDYLKDRTNVQGFIKKTYIYALDENIYIPYVYKKTDIKRALHNGLKTIYEAKSQLLNHLIEIVKNEQTS